VKIFDPGASWRKFFCAIAAMKAVIAILLFATLIRGFCGSSRELSQSLTKSPVFLLLQGKEMMLFPAPLLVLLD
jgi:hypothetical protein